MIFLAQIPETAVLPIWLTRFIRPASKKYGKELPQFFQTPVFQSFLHTFSLHFLQLIINSHETQTVYGHIKTGHDNGGLS